MQWTSKRNPAPPAPAGGTRRAHRLAAWTLRLIAWLVLSLAAAGCSSMAGVKPVQEQVGSSLPLAQTETIGQTFTARDDGLEGALVYLAPGESGDGSVTLRLLSSPTDTHTLRSSTIPISEIREPTFYRFHFEPVAGSAGKDYLLQLETSGAGSIQVGAGAADSYIHGALYVDGRPREAQIAFYLDYDAPRMAMGLLKDAWRWLGWTVALLLLFILPGWGLLDALWPGWQALGWPEKLGLSAGGSLALYPLLFLLTDRLHLHLGAFYAWLPPLLALLWLAYRFLRRRKASPAGTARPRDVRGRLQAWLAGGDLVLVAVIALIVFTRFWAIREVDLPLWHDSYQHAVITQLFLENGGLFESWEPYSPYHSLSVHFGFSAQAAVLGWMSGMNGSQATLVYGQMANILAVVGLLPLAIYLSRGNRWAGAGALLIAGLFSSMPVFYVNWGRFPQLAGQAMLPTAAWMTIVILSRPAPRGAPGSPGAPGAFSGRRAWLAAVLAAGVILAGTLLTYYRMAFGFITFIAAVWLIAWALPTFRLDVRRWLTAAAAGAGIALLTLALLAPWLMQVQGTNLSTAIETGMAKSQPWEYVTADLVAWTLYKDYIQPRFWLLLAAALILSLWRREWRLPALVLWVGLWVAYFMGRLIRLPGSNLISNFSILIALYIPIGLLCGWLIGEAAAWLARRRRRLWIGLATVTLLGAALIGANEARGVTDPKYSTLVTRPDLRAMAWISANIPRDARFLVQGYSIYNRTTAIGSDAGWWIPLLTLRENSMPPQYALLNERPQPEDYTKDVVRLTTGLEETAPYSPAGLRLLCDSRITHVYIGQMQGGIGFEVHQLFQVKDFLNRPPFELVYHQDRVYIFALQPGFCPETSLHP